MSTGFLEESEGVKSSTRLFSFLLLLFTFVFDGFYIYFKYNILMKIADTIGEKNALALYDFSLIDALVVGFTFILLIGVFAPKYLHKLAELGLSLTGKKQ